MYTVHACNKTDYMFTDDITDGFKFTDPIHLKYMTRKVWLGYSQETLYHYPTYYICFQWVYGPYRKTRIFDLTKYQYIKLLRSMVNRRKFDGSFASRGNWINRPDKHSNPLPIQAQAQFRLDIKL